MTKSARTREEEEHGSLHAAAVARGLNGSTALNRVMRGWSVEAALATPPIAKGRPIQIGGVTYRSRTEAFAAAGLDESTIRCRMKRGLSLDEAVALGKRPRGRRPGAIREAALTAGIDPAVVKGRLRLGWPLARALAVEPKRHRKRGEHDEPRAEV